MILYHYTFMRPGLLSEPDDKGACHFIREPLLPGNDCNDIPAVGGDKPVVWLTLDSGERSLIPAKINTCRLTVKPPSRSLRLVSYAQRLDQLGVSRMTLARDTLLPELTPDQIYQSTAQWWSYRGTIPADWITAAVMFQGAAPWWKRTDSGALGEAAAWPDDVEPTWPPKIIGGSVFDLRADPQTVAELRAAAERAEPATAVVEPETLTSGPQMAEAAE